jgi:hypothetical protein
MRNRDVRAHEPRTGRCTPARSRSGGRDQFAQPIKLLCTAQTNNTVGRQPNQACAVTVTPLLPGREPCEGDPFLALGRSSPPISPKAVSHSCRLGILAIRRCTFSTMITPRDSNGGTGSTDKVPYSCTAFAADVGLELRGGSTSSHRTSVTAERTGSQC